VPNFSAKIFYKHQIGATKNWIELNQFNNFVWRQHSTRTWTRRARSRPTTTRATDASSEPSRSSASRSRFYDSSISDEKFSDKFFILLNVTDTFYVIQKVEKSVFQLWKKSYNKCHIEAVKPLFQKLQFQFRTNFLIPINVTDSFSSKNHSHPSYNNGKNSDIMQMTLRSSKTPFSKIIMDSSKVIFRKLRPNLLTLS
jgi:hypothetical protein